MPKHIEKVKVDKSALMRAIEARGTTAYRLSKDMGFNGSYVKNSIDRGAAFTKSGYKLLCMTLGVPEGALLEKEKPEIKREGSTQESEIIPILREISKKITEMIEMWKND